MLLAGQCPRQFIWGGLQRRHYLDVESGSPQELDIYSWGWFTVTVFRTSIIQGQRVDSPLISRILNRHPRT